MSKNIINYSYHFKYTILSIIYNICIYTYVVLVYNNNILLLNISIIYMTLYSHIFITQVVSFIKLFESNGNSYLFILSQNNMATYYLKHVYLNFFCLLVSTSILYIYYDIIYLCICTMNILIYYIILNIYLLVQRRYSYNYYVVYIISTVILIPVILITRLIWNMQDFYIYIIYSDCILILLLSMIIYKGIDNLYLNT